MISRKYSTNSSQSPPRFWCYINIHFITSCRGTISSIAKFHAWVSRFQLSSFSTNSLRVSMKSTIVLPLPCSFRLTLLSCSNMSARCAKWKIKWLFSRLDTISFFPWSLRIDFNCYILFDACIWIAHCIIVAYSSMRASQLAITFWI